MPERDQITTTFDNDQQYSIACALRCAAGQYKHFAEQIEDKDNAAMRSIREQFKKQERDALAFANIIEAATFLTVIRERCTSRDAVTGSRCQLAHDEGEHVIEQTPGELGIIQSARDFQTQRFDETPHSGDVRKDVIL